MSLEFRSVVITGASSGIGLALALGVATSGVTLLLLGRDRTRLQAAAQLCRDQGATAEIAAIDVRDVEMLTQALTSFDAKNPVDLVIANAGVEGSLGPERTVEPLSSTTAQLRINLEGAINTVTPLIEPMRRRGHGAIGLIASLAGLAALPDQPAYSASKAGLIGWGQALIPWLRPYGVSVSIVCPGFVATGMKKSYRGARPFELSAEQAATKIMRGIERRRPMIAFPWPLALLVRAGAFVPARLRHAIADRWFRSHVETSPH
jgi:short-subunit dehydrogenase